MNNRYLYRAKRIDNGEWVEGYLIADEQNEEKCFIGYVFGTNDDGTPHDFDVVAVDPSTICQCAGLRDKNGKLIWENDIVSFLDMYSTENGWSESGCVGKVAWDDETISFQVTNRLSAESYEVLDECLVIGNIFDNTELSEVGECLN